jgi:hypothetical protein
MIKVENIFVKSNLKIKIEYQGNKFSINGLELSKGVTK